ncbi:MAG: c-type cytochrome [Candidatus Lambdaproteobacteria bacterium]|nr:c-type cytochrome [Candidatus Lambdaproteobacteria bacterium]
MAIGLVVGTGNDLAAQGVAPSVGPAAAQVRSAQGDRFAVVTMGRGIYNAACATCHGIHGDGRGPGARGFAQRPADFTRGVYKLRSTSSETPSADLPTDADLERTIREGMPSTEMIPFRNLLTPASIRAVVQYIKTFSKRFEETDPPAIEAKVVTLPQVRPFPPSAESVAAGREVYTARSCADCHGERGEGNADEVDTWGFRVRLVAFQNGVFKSGTSDQDLFRTIATGARGTNMEAYHGQLTEQEVWQVVDFIRSLAERPTSLLGRLSRYLFVVEPSGMTYRRPARR